MAQKRTYDPNSIAPVSKAAQKAADARQAELEQLPPPPPPRACKVCQHLLTGDECRALLDALLADHTRGDCAVGHGYEVLDPETFHCALWERG